MIIKSFKLFESLDEYNIFVIEINDADELAHVLNYLKKIDGILYNKWLLEEVWGYPNWLFVYRDDAVRIFSVSSDRPGLKKRIEFDSQIYPEIFNVNNLNKFNYIYNSSKIKTMYTPRKIQR